MCNESGLSGLTQFITRTVPAAFRSTGQNLNATGHVLANEKILNIFWRRSGLSL